LVAEGERVAEEAAQARAKIVEAIEETKEISREAAKEAKEAAREANHMNRKIESVGIEHNALQREKQIVADKAEKIAQISTETLERVKVIQDEVTGDAK
jgi:hypothetical protein